MTTPAHIETFISIVVGFALSAARRDVSPDGRPERARAAFLSWNGAFAPGKIPLENLPHRAAEASVPRHARPAIHHRRAQARRADAQRSPQHPLRRLSSG
jgi:hypothetical protein